MTFTAPELTGIRWSSVRSCPRKAAYEASGTEPDRERTEQEELILLSGKAIEDIYVQRLALKYGEENVLRQYVVPWPFGAGHVDAYVIPTKTMVEVYSSYKPASAAVDSKVLQLVGYMEFTPECESGALVILNPRDFSQETIPIVKGTERYHDLANEVHLRVDEIGVWDDSDRLPARVCRRPSEARSHFCRFAETCFADAPLWEPEPLSALEPELLPIVEALALAKARERLTRDAIKEIEEKRKGFEAELAERVEAGKYAIGPFELARTDVTRETFSLKRARLAGIPEHVLREHTNLSAHSRWVVKRVEGERVASADDGDEDVPF